MLNNGAMIFFQLNILYTYNTEIKLTKVVQYLSVHIFLTEIEQFSIVYFEQKHHIFQYHQHTYIHKCKDIYVIWMYCICTHVESLRREKGYNIIICMVVKIVKLDSYILNSFGMTRWCWNHSNAILDRLSFKDARNVGYTLIICEAFIVDMYLQRYTLPRQCFKWSWYK